jgi:hypothetical protein
MLLKQVLHFLNVTVTWQMEIFYSYNFIIFSDKYLLSLHVDRLVALL